LNRKKAILVFPCIDSFGIQYPTGLYRIASYCLSKFDVIVFDQRLHRDYMHDLENIIDKSDNILCIGLSVMTGGQIKYAIQISEKFHGRIPIVWGGHHPTLLPSQTISNDFIDYIIVGDGEESFLNLLIYLDGGNIDKPLFLDKKNRNYSFNQLQLNKCSEYINFNKLPIEDCYFVKRDGFRKSFTLETSRGCPFNCSYCHNSIHRKKYQVFKNSVIFECIEYLIDHHKIDGIIFQEDNFFINRKRTKEILVFLKEKVSIGWKSNCRIDLMLKILSEETFISLILESGCKILQFGVESGSDETLKLINKRYFVHDVIKLNRKLSKYPIKVRYNFIVGFPTEKEYDIDKTLKLIDTLKSDNPNMEPPFLNIYTPYPGTSLYNLAVENGFVEPLDTVEWINYKWNSSNGKWLNKERSKYLENLSLKYFNNSLYLKQYY
jgi:anaerobic magnesium-protoporphyrin IX monomethyl ester cyclase